MAINDKTRKVRKPNKRQQSKEATRQRILKAAIDAFYDKGYIASNVVEIAQKADVSVGAVFFHFTDKRNLFLSTIEESNRRYAERLSDAVDRVLASERTLMEKIDTIAQSHLKIAMAYTEFYTGAINELFMVDHQFEFIPKALCRDIIAHIEILIKEGVDAGVFKSATQTANAAHLLFYLPIITLSHRGLYEEDTVSLPERCRDNLETLLRGIMHDTPL